MKSLWRGPQKDGITFSMLSNFLVCRHRFWLKYIRGLVPIEEFNHALEYGNFWHEAEEAYGKGKDTDKAIRLYARKLRELYPTKEKEINKWASIASLQFKLYSETILKKKRKERRYIATEHTFRIRYPFDGRFVTLRGKIDRLMEKHKILHLEEHKTKGQIDIAGIQGSLHHNMQTMMYHIAARNLKYDPKTPKHLFDLKPRGTYYNVIRRPLSDRYSIRQRKTETDAQFLKRLEQDMKKKKEYYFMEFPTLIRNADIARFKQEVLHPCLHQLCDWWNSIKGDPANPFNSPHHFRFPFGVYNSLSGGFRGDYYDLITRGTERGLQQNVALFRELQDE